MGPPFLLFGLPIFLIEVQKHLDELRSITDSMVLEVTDRRSHRIVEILRCVWMRENRGDQGS
jgi:hypothetical protein